MVARGSCCRRRQDVPRAGKSALNAELVERTRWWNDFHDLPGEGSFCHLVGGLSNLWAICPQVRRGLFAPFDRRRVRRMSIRWTPLRPNNSITLRELFGTSFQMTPFRKCGSPHPRGAEIEQGRRRPGGHRRPCVDTWEANDVAAQTPRRRKIADPSTTKFVKATVLLRVEVHARLAAAAALRGVDRSTYAAECIENGLKGIVVIDRRRKPDDHVDSSDEGIGGVEAA